MLPRLRLRAALIVSHDLPKAEQEFKAAADLALAGSFARLQLADFYQLTRRVDDAVKVLTRAWEALGRRSCGRGTRPGPTPRSRRRSSSRRRARAGPTCWAAGGAAGPADRRHARLGHVQAGRLPAGGSAAAGSCGEAADERRGALPPRDGSGEDRPATRARPRPGRHSPRCRRPVDRLTSRQKGPARKERGPFLGPYDRPLTNAGVVARTQCL